MGEPLRAAFDLRAARAYPQRPFQPRIRVCLAGRSSPPADFPTVRIAHVPTRHPQRLRCHPLWSSNMAKPNYSFEKRKKELAKKKKKEAKEQRKAAAKAAGNPAPVEDAETDDGPHD